MCDFEKKVKDSLIECGVEVSENAPSHTPRVGVAVSGGADSISLLLALSQLFSPLYVITVNHNIRPAEESRGDVDFVLEVCEKLRRGGTSEINCDVVELERGEVERAAAERGGGIDEAARHLRYAAFGRFVTERGLDALCLAHNRNDQLEPDASMLRSISAMPVDGSRHRRSATRYFSITETA